MPDTLGTARAYPMRSSQTHSNWLPALLVWSAVILVTVVFVWIISDIVRHGIGQLSWEFLTTAPRNAGRAGGIGPILISTLLILAVCMAVAVPLGIGTALLLAEFTSVENRFGRLVRRSLDVLAGTPSIVFGLFGLAFFSKPWAWAFRFCPAA